MCVCVCGSLLLEQNNNKINKLRVNWLVSEPFKLVLAMKNEKHVLHCYSPFSHTQLRKRFHKTTLTDSTLGSFLFCLTFWNRLRPTSVDFPAFFRSYKTEFKAHCRQCSPWLFPVPRLTILWFSVCGKESLAESTNPRRCMWGGGRWPHVLPVHTDARLQAPAHSSQWNPQQAMIT